MTENHTQSASDANGYDHPRQVKQSPEELATRKAKAEELMSTDVDPGTAQMAAAMIKL